MTRENIDIASRSLRQQNESVANLSLVWLESSDKGMDQKHEIVRQQFRIFSCETAVKRFCSATFKPV